MKLKRKDIKEGKEYLALKSIEFETMSYPEIEIKGLSLYTQLVDSNVERGKIDRCDEATVELNMSVNISRKELMSLLHALKDTEEFWLEEDLPAIIKIGVNKKTKMDFYEEVETQK